MASSNRFPESSVVDPDPNLFDGSGPQYKYYVVELEFSFKKTRFYV